MIDKNVKTFTLRINKIKKKMSDYLFNITQ